MSFISLSSQLIGKLEPITTVKEVYNHEPRQPEGYPFISVVPSATRDEVSDSCSNDRYYTFRISIVDDLGDDDVTRSEVDDRIMGIADECITAISVKLDYTGIIHQLVNTGEMKYIERDGGFARVFEVFIEFRTLQSIL